MISPTDVAGVPIVTPAEVFDMFDGGLVRDSAVPLVGIPLLVIDLDAGKRDRLDAVACRLPCVTVGVGTLPSSLAAPPDLDLLLTDVPRAGRPWRSCPEGVNRALSTVSLSIACAPQAAVTLVQLLRIGRELAFGDALIAESLAWSVLLGGREHAAWREGRDQPPAAADESPAVEVVRMDRSLTVRLARPHARNTVDAATRDGLSEAFELASRDAGIECIDLRGAGPAFCGGAEVDARGEPPHGLDAHLTRSRRDPVRAMARCASRTVAHVHGDCVGPGVELAALAGRVVAAADTTFQLPEMGMGLVPGWGGTVSLPRRIGRQRTAWMALTGAVIDVDTARAWGLVDVG